MKWTPTMQKLPCHDDKTSCICVFPLYLMQPEIKRWETERGVRVLCDSLNNSAGLWVMLHLSHTFKWQTRLLLQSTWLFHHLSDSQLRNSQAPKHMSRIKRRHVFSPFDVWRVRCLNSAGLWFCKILIILWHRVPKRFFCMCTQWVILPSHVCFILFDISVKKRKFPSCHKKRAETREKLVKTIIAWMFSSSFLFKLDINLETSLIISPS